ncbi:hypothetical protein [Bradyrhizobium tropiciagri]|uniref:hypothetical protein n=1 Tax=Bradyrhizobium tropiciagri TaxID=312253 RepID=UPI000AFB7F0B|nr:hypothetical protein [Bradyrhizobium tropiciagri]
MRKIVTIRQALSDPGFLGHALPGDSWFNWRTLLIGAIGEPLTEAERTVWRELTGRDAEPGVMVDTWLTVAGRRSGKSKAMATLCVFLSTLVDWSDELGVGERGLALIVSPSERQSANILRYALALIETSPLLAGLLENETQECLTLGRRVDIEVQSANWRRARGSTCVAICVDEAAFLHSADDSANSDRELLIALKPSLATTGGPLLITSSPSTMEGVTYEIHKRHAGPQGDHRILVVQASTKALNAKISDETINRAFADDPIAAEAEFGGQFRKLSTAFLPRAVVEAAVDKGIGGRCVSSGTRYEAHVDPAGGIGRDSLGLCIGHKLIDPSGRTIAIVDALLEIFPPFDTDESVARCSQILMHWGVYSITSDHYAADWVPGAFRRYGIEVTHNPISTSDIYANVIPLFTSKRVRLLDHQRSIDQLCKLRRKVGQAGREAVTHPANSHDDLAAAICGLLWKLSAPEGGCHGWDGFVTRELARMGVTPRRLDTDYDNVRVPLHPGEPDFGWSFPTTGGR